MVSAKKTQARKQVGNNVVAKAHAVRGVFHSVIARQPRRASVPKKPGQSTPGFRRTKLREGEGGNARRDKTGIQEAIKHKDAVH